MKTYKEYPATHSMSTAWYVADEEGNVGIIDFNENGPVPWETEETCIEELVYGHEENYKNKRFLPIALTDEQIDDLMENPHSPEEEKFWYDCIVQIDLEKETAFFELAKNQDFEIELCVSKERGLYGIDAYHCTSESEINGRYQILHSSSLKKMIEQGIILQVFDRINYWMNDEWVDDVIVHKKEFSKAPYYLFHQPYWTEELPICMNVPKHPVKIEQFPKELKERVLRIPVIFKETESFQIAKWHPCSMSSNDTQYFDACEYDLLPVSDEIKAYINTEIVVPSCFFKYCSEKEKYGCKDCDWDCYTSEDHCFTNKPTVLMIAHPLHRMDYLMKTKSDIITWNSVWLPFLPKIPLKIPVGPGVWSSRPYEYCPDEKTISKQVNQEKIMAFLNDNRKWLEDIVARFNPRVVILCEEVEAFLDKLYKTTESHITINGVDYPMFRQAEMENHRGEIERLAMMPYQGKEIPHIISIEEMEKIKQQQ